MVFETVRRARQRILANEAARVLAHAASVAVAALALLLILGTQILAWPWLVLLLAVSLICGGWLIWRRIPTRYATAQRIDRALHLADALSTAVYFAEAGDNSAPAEIRRAQWSQAEQTVRAVDPRLAIPMRIPRALYGTAAALLLAGTLFLLRYGLDRSLDLRAPLATMLQAKLGGARPRLAAQRKGSAARKPERRPDGGISPEDALPAAPGGLDAAPDSALETVDEPNVGNARVAGTSQAEPANGAKDQAKSSEAPGADTNAEQPSGDRTENGPGKQGQGNEKPGAGNSSENSSLMGKFRDAMSGLLSRLKPQPDNQKGAGTPKGQQPGSQAGNSRQNEQPGQPEGGQPSGTPGGKSGDETQNAQDGKAGAGQGGQQAATKQAGSGIGRQDGSKDIKLAEQVAAMGKISEIIGKRAANVTGEATIEVRNSNPQLRTPYASASVQHGSSGGEINRDEVPLALQAYVQQYFEEVRKQALPQKP